MHRLLVVKLFPGNKDKFQVVADSSNPNVSEDNPISIKEAGGSGWSGYPDELPKYSSVSVFPLPCQMKVSELGGLHPYHWTDRVRRVWRGISLFS